MNRTGQVCRTVTALQARNVGSLLSSFPLNTILTELQGLDHIKGRGLSYTLAPIPESAIPPQSVQCFHIRPLSYSWSHSYFYPNLMSYFHFAAGNTETHRKPVLRPRWFSAQGSGITAQDSLWLLELSGLPREHLGRPLTELSMGKS